MRDAMTATLSEAGNFLLYDGECPVCSRYVEFVHLQEAVGPVRLINAREAPQLVRELNDLGFAINDGMVMQLHGRLFYGAACVREIARHSQQSIWGRLQRIMFDGPLRSRYVYAVLKRGRNLLLRILRRSKIDESVRHESAHSNR